MIESIDDAVNVLLNYAFEKHIKIQLTHRLDPYAPSASYPDRRLIIINMAWHDHQQLPYTIAHEIGHVINQDSSVAYFHPSKFSIEGGANRFAVKLLRQLFEIKEPRQLIEAFHVPGYMTDYVQETAVAYE